jgi:hypothetical protein
MAGDGAAWQVPPLTVEQMAFFKREVDPLSNPELHHNRPALPL